STRTWTCPRPIPRSTTWTTRVGPPRRSPSRSTPPSPTPSPRPRPSPTRSPRRRTCGWRCSTSSAAAWPCSWTGRSRRAATAPRCAPTASAPARTSSASPRPGPPPRTASPSSADRMTKSAFAFLLAFSVLVGCGGTERAVVPVDVSHVEPPNPYASEEVKPIDVHAAGEPIDGPLFLSGTVPDWAADAVFYQLFPERFRNGDPSNDPTRASLEFPVERVPGSWAVTPWTSDWYARAGWETARGEDFYEDGVFDRRYGGDLQGVIDQLDYLDSLGVNALYFNPVFYARSLHKYDGNSFHHIDPYFGPD